ncbi:glycosyltransferase family 2 protein [Candidatus Daviesbacteria bacterium]|nr:glycosyltransferase family 2 protein [Candidatus Daviesbacteria bacterium]
MISCIIVNLNEAENLKKCLQSLGDFAKEIIVVDLGSTDNSLEVAKDHNATVINHHRVDYVELVRNFSISKAKYDWILILDPDEQIPSQLKKVLGDIIKGQEYSAANIPRKNIFLGKWIAHTNWWPDRHIRFFKKGSVKWSDKIHSYPKVEGKVFQVPEKEELAIVHLGYANFSQFIKRQNRYSSIEAENRYGKGIRTSPINFFWWPTREFLVRYIRHKGFLDGFLGFALVFLMMVYQLTVFVKIWEIKKTKLKQ